MADLSAYYFTFGSDPNFPYQDGYVVVKARGRSEACKMFNHKFGTRDGMVNCAFIYSAKEWAKAIPNHHYPCFEIITAIDWVQCPNCHQEFKVPLYQETYCPECGHVLQKEGE